MGKVIGVISLKGGAGKTSVVSSLGAAVSNFGKSVLLVDGNLSSPSLGLHLGIVEPEKTLHHVLNKTAHPREAIYECGNFHIMPASIMGKTEKTVLGLRDKLKTVKSLYDVIIIDSSPSLDDETLAVILASDSLIAVTTPDHPTLSATIRAVNMAKQRGTPIVGVILNKVHGDNFEIPLEVIEEMLEVPVLAVIPYDKGMLKALSKMESPVESSPNSKGSKEFKKLAAVLIGEKYKPFSFSEFFGLPPKREEINRQIFYDRVFRE